MALFKYNNPVGSRFTLNNGKEYALYEGGEYELPEDNAHIQSLQAQGYITLISEPVVQKETKEESQKSEELPSEVKKPKQSNKH